MTVYVVYCWLRHSVDIVGVSTSKEKAREYEPNIRRYGQGFPSIWRD